MLLEQRHKLLLERHFAMMFRLPFEILNGDRSSRRTCLLFSRPFGTCAIQIGLPGVETPGYSQDVPSGQGHVAYLGPGKSHLLSHPPQTRNPMVLLFWRSLPSPEVTANSR